MSDKKVHKFITESNSGRHTITVTGQVAHKSFEHTDGYYESLEFTDDSFIYSWKHGGGQGSITLPDHVIFGIPDLLVLLDRTYGGAGMFGETRIYSKEPIAILFNKK